MAKYKVMRDCHGYKGAYWKEGSIVNLSDDDEKPPRHFERIDGKEPEAVPVEPESPNTFSEINAANDAGKPNTGIAHRTAAHHKAGKTSKR